MCAALAILVATHDNSVPETPDNVGYAAHPFYNTFGITVQSFSAPSRLEFTNTDNYRTIYFSVNDDAVYRTAYISINGSNWTAVNLTGETLKGNWLKGETLGSLRVNKNKIPLHNNTDNYIIIYTCTKDSSIWNCHDNKWQLRQFNTSKMETVQNIANSSNMTNNTITTPTEDNNNCDCPVEEYCSHSVCLLNVSGNTYFVATDGNDNNPGTFSQPWGTWQKAFDTADAGDIVYFREGIWYPAVSVTYDGTGLGNSGTESHHIIYENYPGETPILDLSNYPYTGDMSGLAVNDVTYVEFRGLTIRNTPQNVNNQWIDGLQFSNCGTIWVDKVSSYGHGGYGIWFVGYDALYLTNTDSYNNADFLADEPGNRADGFQISSGSEAGDYTLVTGCRAWNNSDDGFEVSTQQEVHFYNNWVFNNGRLDYGNGIGLKIGPSLESNLSKREFYNNIVADNKGFGVSHSFLNDATHGPIGAFYNNFIYNNSMGFNDDPGEYDCTSGGGNTVHRNNIVYASTYFGFQAYLQACEYQPEVGPVYDTSDHNTWLKIMASPYWQINPAVTVANADFVSLDTSQLTRPRKADGSLPDVTFGHLASGSDLIDAGVNVELPYSGTAPDIGAFESPYTAAITTPATCSGSDNRLCDVTNGAGIQYRTCTNGNWSVYDTCTMTSCNSGYHNASNVCVIDTVSPPIVTGVIIADHNAVRDFNNIPTCWLDRAKQNIKITYHHTSHGSQISTGMNYLRNYVNSSKYAYGPSVQSGSLFFMDNYDTDLGNGDWPSITRTDLNNNPALNNAMWSWCGQVSDYTTNASMSSHYLNPATSIMNDYEIPFVYMTGHLSELGTGPSGTVYQANNIIRQHVNANGGILFDFADIESYDPDGNYYPFDTDACGWCTTWCNAHPTDCQNLPSNCAHSHGFNCVQKAKAYWWMLARIEGWNGDPAQGCS